MHSNEFVKDKKNTVNKFNNYFVNIGLEFTENMKQINKSSICEYLDQPITHSMFLNQTNKSEIFSIVNKMKSMTSTDANFEIVNVVITAFKCNGSGRSFISLIDCV